VYSFEVNALNSPPMPSTTDDSSRELGRRSVPLKNMCSAKCAIPRFAALS
jgi:hypothetical protein